VRSISGPFKFSPRQSSHMYNIYLYRVYQSINYVIMPRKWRMLFLLQ